MKVLVIGASGQLGKCIYDEVEYIFNMGLLNNEYYFATHDMFDITNMSSMENYIYCHLRPDCIINCAAYTNVEKAEDDIVGAFNVNSKGVNNLVNICNKYGIMLFHISTDYVYDSGICYEDSKLNPLGIYAQSKRDGEIFIEKSNLNKWFIFRTSWLFSEYSGNYVTNILKRTDNVTNLLYGTIDEIGCPTYARRLAEIIVGIINNSTYKMMDNGIYNACGNGYVSRYEFTKKIIEGYIELEVFRKKYKTAPEYAYYSKLLRVNPITQDEAYKIFNLKAPRPKGVIISNSKLDDVLYEDNTFEQYDLYENWAHDLGDCLSRYNKLHINDKK